MGLDSLKSYSKNDIDGCFCDKKNAMCGRSIEAERITTVWLSKMRKSSSYRLCYTYDYVYI